MSREQIDDISSLFGSDDEGLGESAALAPNSVNGSALQLFSSGADAVIETVISFLDRGSLAALSACSRGLQRLVFRSDVGAVAWSVVLQDVKHSLRAPLSTRQSAYVDSSHLFDAATKYAKCVFPRPQDAGPDQSECDPSFLCRSLWMTAAITSPKLGCLITGWIWLRDTLFRYIPEAMAAPQQASVMTHALAATSGTAILAYLQARGQAADVAAYLSGSHISSSGGALEPCYALPSQHHASVKKVVPKLVAKHWLPVYEAVGVEVRLRAVALRLQLEAACAQQLTQLRAAALAGREEGTSDAVNSCSTVGSSGSRLCDSSAVSQHGSTTSAGADLTIPALELLRCHALQWGRFRAWIEAVDSFLGPLNLAVQRERDRRADAAGASTPFVYAMGPIAWRSLVLLSVSSDLRLCLQTAAGVLRRRCQQLRREALAATRCCQSVSVAGTIGDRAAPQETQEGHLHCAAASSSSSSSAAQHAPTSSITGLSGDHDAAAALAMYCDDQEGYEEVMRKHEEALSGASRNAVGRVNLSQGKPSSAPPSLSLSTLHAGAVASSWRQVVAEGDSIDFAAVATSAGDDYGRALAQSLTDKNANNSLSGHKRRRSSSFKGSSSAGGRGHDDEDEAADAAAAAAADERMREAQACADELELTMMSTNDAAAVQEEAAAEAAVRHMIPGYQSNICSPPGLASSTGSASPAGASPTGATTADRSPAAPSAYSNAAAGGRMETLPQPTDEGYRQLWQVRESIKKPIDAYVDCLLALRSVREAAVECDTADDAIGQERPTQGKLRKLLRLPLQLAVTAAQAHAEELEALREM